MERMRVLLVGDERMTQRYRTALQDKELDIVGNVYDEEEVLEMITTTNANVALLINDGSSRFYRCCQQIYMLRPRTVPVAVMSENNAEMLEKVLQTGVHHVLPDAPGAPEFVQMLSAVFVNESTRIVTLENTSGEQNKSRVVMIYGAKDGIGKTSFAVNLAITLARDKQKVAILDLDFQNGDVNVFFGLESKTTISELIQEQSAPNIDLIRKHMSLHSSGVNILCAPRSPEFAEGITGPQIEKIIAAIRSYFDYVILDAPPVFNDVNISCIDAASVILYVTGGDISAIRNSRKSLYLLLALTRKEKVRLIIGKERESEIKPAAIAKTLEFPIYGSLPYDYKTVTTALNLGKAVITTSPASKYSKAVKEIAYMVNQGMEPKSQKKGWVLNWRH